MSKRLAKLFRCPAEFTLAILEGKWKTAILCCLQVGPCRFSDLKKRLPQLSDKVLSERLGDLVTMGLVVRRQLPGRRVHTYALSPVAWTLRALLQELSSWGVDHAETFGVRLEAPTEWADRQGERSANLLQAEARCAAHQLPSEC